MNRVSDVSAAIGASVDREAAALQARLGWARLPAYVNAVTSRSASQRHGVLMEQNCAPPMP